MLTVNPLIKPMTIWNNLDKDASVLKEYLPTHEQIGRLKSQLARDNRVEGDEIARVDAIINENQYKDNIDPNIAFIFASRNGTGSHNDPLSVCITALNWLIWLKEYVIIACNNFFRYFPIFILYHTYTDTIIVTRYIIVTEHTN